MSLNELVLEILVSIILSSSGQMENEIGIPVQVVHVDLKRKADGWYMYLGDGVSWH